jgi:RimJ/RimL family protein N-acetyltransferase
MLKKSLWKQKVFQRNPNYYFKSERLGFRQWQSNDLAPLFALNSDREVMKYFPSTITLDKTREFISKMSAKYENKGYCYFAVDRLDTNEFIGFIGLSDLTIPVPFTPCVDIGWRLDKKHWKNGFAQEGALRCLKFGFEDLRLDYITAVAPKINEPSLAVMERIGMTKIQQFIHPQLSAHPHLKECYLYRQNAVTFSR